jgi:hypothetical protein
MITVKKNQTQTTVEIIDLINDVNDDIIDLTHMNNLSLTPLNSKLMLHYPPYIKFFMLAHHKSLYTDFYQRFRDIAGKMKEISTR